MRWLTEDAHIVCKHEIGRVTLQFSQSLVTIARRRALVEPDPEGRPIIGCPEYGPAIKPCTNTLKVEAGYSNFVRIAGRRVCLDTVTGLTNGTPPGAVKYVVKNAGQPFVNQIL